jgi:di/tricarboxylate transporter
MASLSVVLVVATILVILSTLVLTQISTDVVMLCGLGFLVVTGVLDTKTALSGFSNEGVMTVAVLFVVASGLRQAGAMSRLAGGLLGRSRSARIAVARLALPVAALSALLNNTPIVAALLPAVTEWSRQNRVPASKMLMPLSFATILGGTITVIGTSSNLVVTGLILANLGSVPGLRPLGIFDITGVGLIVAALGGLAVVFVVPALLPDRRAAVSKDDDPYLYTTELLLEAGSPLVGRSIEDAGLRHLPGAFLAELDRGETVLPAVEPTTRLQAGDRLVFVGPREAVLDLKRLPGLVAAPEQASKLGTRGEDRVLVEAVVSPRNPLIGRTIRDGEFRSAYNAVVVAVARAAERLPGRIGDIVLTRGDLLLLEAHPSWVQAWRARRDFYLVSQVEDSANFMHSRAPVALVILLCMVAAAATELTSMFVAAFVAAVALVLTRCVSAQEARRSIEWSTLVAIAAAFGLGEAVRASGGDVVLAELMVAAGAGSPWLALVVIYVSTALLTELITNNAAAALMFPLALSLAAQLGVSPMPFCVAIMFAASASFSSPVGYQTNMMVMGPGGYRFGDYLRAGPPVQVAAGVGACVAIPWFFSF